MSEIEDFIVKKTWFRLAVAVVMVVILAIVCAVLALLPVLDTNAGAYDVYFADGYTMPPANGLDGDYFDFPWATEVDLTAQMDRLPKLSEVADMTARGLVRADGALYGVEITWRWEEATLLLHAYRSKPEDLAYARAYVMDHDHATQTVTGNITVYGVGTTESASRVLEFSREDGSFYQIEGYFVSLEDMGAVLDFYLNTPLDFSAFDLA